MARPRSRALRGIVAAVPSISQVEKPRQDHATHTCQAPAVRQVCSERWGRAVSEAGGERQGHGHRMKGPGTLGLGQGGKRQGRREWKVPLGQVVQDAATPQGHGRPRRRLVPHSRFRLLQGFSVASNRKPNSETLTPKGGLCGRRSEGDAGSQCHGALRCPPARLLHGASVLRPWWEREDCPHAHVPQSPAQQGRVPRNLNMSPGPDSTAECGAWTHVWTHRNGWGCPAPLARSGSQAHAPSVALRRCRVSLERCWQ